MLERGEIDLGDPVRSIDDRDHPLELLPARLVNGFEEDGEDRLADIHHRVGREGGEGEGPLVESVRGEAEEGDGVRGEGKEESWLKGGRGEEGEGSGNM